MTDDALTPPAPQAPSITDVPEKRRRLARAKLFATGLLALAVLILIAARLYPHPSFAAALIRAAAEAAIVGGLADWFAITALFRRPLGLPIPHTALIPARKDEIGRSLGHFVSDQFLAPELLIARLRQQNRALQVARWLETPAVAIFIAERLVALVPAVLAGADDAELRAFFATLAHEGLKRVDLQPTVDGVIDALVRRRRHLTLADAVLDLLTPALVGLRDPLIARVGERTGRFIPRYFDRKIADELMTGLVTWIAVARTPGTDERRRLEEWLDERIRVMRAAPDYGALIARAQASVLNHPALVQSLGTIWDELKRELLAESGAPGSGIEPRGVQLVQTIGRLLADSRPVQQHFNAGLESALVSTIAPWRRGIGNYIAEIVAGWDGAKVAELIELQVGRDLQYIRVNGTLVGAAIGSALFLLGSALPALRGLLFGDL